MGHRGQAHLHRRPRRNQRTSLSSEAANGEIYGCINYYNGWICSDAGDRNHGHNTYCQSHVAQKQRCTISWASFDVNAQIYGSDLAYVVNYEFRDNIVFGAGTPGPANSYGENAQNLYTDAGNFHDNVFDGNCFYQYGGATYPTSPEGKTSEYIAGPAHNAVDCSYTDNYTADGAYSQLQFSDPDVITNMTITGNVFSTGYVVDKDGYDALDPSSLLYDASVRLANTFNSLTKPATNYVKVIPADAYEVGRGHVAVYNWEDVATVDVDISSFMPVGATYGVFAAQNPLGGMIDTGTYGGGTITLSTVAQTVATPTGLSAVPATGPEFNAYIIRIVSLT